MSRAHLLDAATEAAKAAQCADQTIAEIEAKLPPRPVRFEIVGVDERGWNKFAPESPWTHALHREALLLSSIKSARSRARRISEEFERYAKRYEEFQ